MQTPRLVLLAALVWSGLAVAVSAETPRLVQVDLARAVHTMAGGIGASWHAIGPTSFWYEGLIHRDNRTSRGSGYGGNPPLAFVEAWNDLRRHASWLGLDFIRVEIDRRMYEPARGQFDWSNQEMRTLFAILDHCQKVGVDVFLTEMWQDTAWNTHPGINRLQSAAQNVDDFAVGYATLIEELVRNRGYGCIRWVVITNEPGGEWSWWLGPDGKPADLMPAIRALRKELDRRGLKRIAISGPDRNNVGMEPARDFDFDDPAVGAHDAHCYTDHAPAKELRHWADRAHARGVPFFLSEFGHFFTAPCEGTNFALGGPRSDAAKRYGAQLVNAEKVITGLNLGVDGFNRWSFANRGDLDGQWQLVRTFNAVNWDYLPRVDPEPVPYYCYAMLTRFAARHSQVLAIAADAPLLAAALRSPKGNVTVYLLNRSATAQSISVSFRGTALPSRLTEYRVTEESLGRPNFRLAALAQHGPGGNGVTTLTLPPASLTTLTTFALGPDAPGIITDE